IQVILYHTHHASGVTDIVGLSIQVILYHTHHASGVTDIVGLSMQSDLYYTHFFKCSHSPPMLAIPHFLYMNFDISVCFIADFPHYSWKANKNQKCSL
uniref:hypothetical protein n=1 Tax=Monoglobus pectinilyticus TaxID=1981510 RepID=UPI003AB862ED